MKSLEQLLIQARSAVRAAQARVPGLTPRPTRLVLRLNDLHLGPNLLRATGAPLKEKEWRDTIVRFERWLGPLRLTIAGGEPAQSGLLPALVRFGNRLECPTHVVTGGPISPEQAEAMVDWGLSAVTVLVGGIDEVSHRAAVGTRLDEAVATVEAFREARAKRKRPLGLYVCVPLTDANTGGAGAVAGWARQAGAGRRCGRPWPSATAWPGRCPDARRRSPTSWLSPSVSGRRRGRRRTSRRCP